MKVSEIPYKRYTIEEGKADFAKFKNAAKNAKCADDVINARETHIKRLIVEYSTAASLANCRFTLNTRDEFYSQEMAYYDEHSPLFEKLLTDYADIMLSSPFRAELEKKLNSQLFKSYETAKKAFDERIIAESQEENAVVTEYSKFMSELEFDYDGKKMPLSVLRGYLEDSNRAVRKSAAEAIGTGLSKVGDRLDDIYDRLVKIRTKMAKKMGYKNFVELGYYRMGRTDYNAEMVAKFRENVLRDLVPCVARIKAQTANELGLNRIMYYDDAVYTVGEAPTPITDSESIFPAAQKMYDDMSEEIGAFMHEMRDAEAFDVVARDGKWGGGYCTEFAKYKQPFILANFNGTSGDVDVITHEFGHALASSFVYKYGDVELSVGGMETAECHSMSMEFLCWPYMESFFGDAADKYRKKHLLSALSFIPYGVIVDEFQHIMYEQYNLTPEQRKEVYRRCEEKYHPYMSFEGLPYLEEGTRWQYQMHIYETPFYYIDYCLAQTVAIGFLLKSRDNYREALDSYLKFAKAGGTKPFGQLVSDAGIASPFKYGALSEMSKKVKKTASEL